MSTKTKDMLTKLSCSIYTLNYVSRVIYTVIVTGFLPRYGFLLFYSIFITSRRLSPTTKEDSQKYLFLKLSTATGQFVTMERLTVPTCGRCKFNIYYIFKTNIKEEGKKLSPVKF